MIRFPDGMRDRLKAAAATACRSLNSEIITRLASSFDEKPAAAPPADYSDEVTDADLAALNAIGERAMTGEAFSLVAGPAWAICHEPSAGLDVDRLDRLTTIVDRTRLALGTNAARDLWPMLGLPPLRTSSRRSSSKEQGPDLLSALENEGFGAPLPTSIERKPAKRGQPRKDGGELKQPESWRCRGDRSIEAFLQQACEISGDHHDVERVSDLFDAYVRFCLNSGLYAVHGATFQRRMPGMTRLRFKTADGERTTQIGKSKTAGATVYRGLRLKAGPE